MARKMLIVHGYSDASSSFKDDLGQFFVDHGEYGKEDICYADYSSMDDQATFRDFADKLDEDYEKLRVEKGFEDEQIDVACHSTGALVVRAWLAMRFARRTRRELDLLCPVEHLLMFAPANFGSDLARMGQSLLGKAKATFFSKHSHSEDFMESGRRVLQGLEPASPFQWELSDHDLFRFNEDDPHDSGFFDPTRPPKERCYPFVFAAGYGYGGLQSRLLRKRKKPGTDGTVRICGTSLNGRKCTIDFRQKRTVLVWWATKRHEQIPFAVFKDFNHGSIVHPKKRLKRFLAPYGPGTLALEALKVKSKKSYAEMARRFAKVSLANYKEMPESRKRNRDRYQQIFFRAYDDVDREVDDFYVDFFVVRADGEEHETLTAEWDSKFESTFYRHSARSSCRAMMINLRQLEEFLAKLRKAEAKLVVEIAATSPVSNISYQGGRYEVYDAAAQDRGLRFIEENTTLLVRVVLNRRESDKLMKVECPPDPPLSSTI